MVDGYCATTAQPFKISVNNKSIDFIIIW
jgi:hypothetical protein